MIYFLRSGVPGVRRAALRACTVMAEQAPILTAYEFATKEGEAWHRIEPAALSQATCRGPQGAQAKSLTLCGVCTSQFMTSCCVQQMSGPGPAYAQASSHRNFSVSGIDQAAPECRWEPSHALRRLPAGIPALLVRLTTKMAYNGNRQMLADSITLLRMLLASQVELVSAPCLPWLCASRWCAVAT